MKNKTKIMLGLAALTAGTLAAGATGTFAWFTTNKTATATYSNIVAVGTSGKLKAKIRGVTDTSMNDTASYGENATANGTTSYTSDVSSGDGLTFKHPDWVAATGNDQKVHSLIDVSQKAGYFVQFKVDIINVGTESVIPQLHGISITMASGTSKFADWTRVAINTSVADSGSFLTSATGNSTYVFQKSISDTKDNKYASGYSTETSLMTLTDIDSKVLKATATADLAIDLSSTALTTYDETKVTPVCTIGVSVWLEGTMEDNQDDVLNKNEAVSVALTFTSRAAA